MPSSRTLADATVALMLRVIKPLGDLITTLPVGPEHPGCTAGPSFELFYESDYLMPHREAAWTLLEPSGFARRAWFSESLQNGCDPVASALVAPVAQALDEIADTLAAHFADRAARSAATPEARRLRGLPRPTSHYCWIARPSSPPWPAPL